LASKAPKTFVAGDGKEIQDQNTRKRNPKAKELT